ncbi:hypothetical protein MFRU_019g00620 [Monilinia fructicola]|uniref:C3H1-type domain-containing protein n=1 Tax=Monilinia fructicola TaxID=38448 RepID=A0A5M9JAC4_MONFR|nr:hypothetical protein EYC84_008883 [Monilinia fructicola]KAG4028773.1 hypothetical protein MFRU_019g00620 [Monilinia fructicola]
MVVCRFWQQGNCKFGNTCRNEHFDQSANSNKNGFNNRFAPLQNQSANQSNSNSRNYNTHRGDGAHIPFSLDSATIKQDLTTDRPQWILSAYGPGRHAPEQLFGGPAREQSFEEMRLLHYIAAASGNAQPAIQDAERLWQEADQQIQNALNDVDGAINYIIAADNKHPNRNDVCQQGTSTDQTPWVQRNPSSGINSFGAPSQTATSTFGQPSTQNASAFGQPSSAFGGPSQGFGTAQQGGTSGSFGQPSALGQNPSAFGSAFGQPSQVEQRAGAFGNPSVMGQKTNPFGAPSNSGANAGQSGLSSFGGSSNAFGQPSLNPLGGTFTSNALPPGIQQSQVNPMVQNTNPLAQANSFGQPSANPFGSNGGSAQPFGAPQVSQNPFGASNAQPMNAMQNQLTNTASQAQQFGNQQGFGNLHMIAGAPSAPGASNSNIFSPNFRPPPPDSNTLEHPPADRFIRLRPDGTTLESFNGLPVVYKDGEPGTNINGKWHKIWCPRGYPGPNKATELENAVFDEKTTTAYLQARQTGAFPGGVMPMIPPKREWCLWNF